MGPNPDTGAPSLIPDIMDSGDTTPVSQVDSSLIVDKCKFGHTVTRSSELLLNAHPVLSGAFHRLCATEASQWTQALSKTCLGNLKP